METNYWIRPILVTQRHSPKTVLTHMVDPDVVTTYPVCIYYIEGPKQNIIIDSGCPPSMPYGSQVEKEGLPFYGEDRFYGGWDAVVEGLAQLGLKTEDIDIVIVSHVHFEHMGYVKEYPNARFIVQKDELAFGLNPLPPFRPYYSPEILWELERHPGKEVIDGDAEIVPGIKVLKCPGHTPGLQAVAIDTSEGTVVFGSDLINTYHNFYPDDPELGTPQPFTSFIPPGLFIDMYQCYESYKKIRAVADHIIPGHERRIISGNAVTVGRIPPLPYIPGASK